MENKNDQILNKLQKEENSSKKRMFIYSSIPIILTIILVLISYSSVMNANQEVKELREQKADLLDNITVLNTDISQKSDSIAQLKEAMELAINYKDKRFEFNFGIDKYMHSRYPKQIRLLDEMRNLIESGNAKWYLGGTTLEKGFDSPSFAAYMLNRFTKSQVEISDRYILPTVLTKIQSPSVGDIVFYEHGYAMFYFEYKNEPFVIGMTPLGLSSLQYDFGVKRLGFAKVEY